MKTLTQLCCIFSLILLQSSVHAERLYKWKDAKGVTQYGDKPPANVRAQPLVLPKITVIDNYAEQWKPLDFKDTKVKKQAQTQAKTSSIYTKLAFLAPKANQAIRANNGDVSAIVSIKPPLKNGDQLIFSIDGKALPKSTSRTANFANLERGNHNIGVKIVDKDGKTLKSSSVGFNVLRASSLGKTNSNQAPRLPQTRTFNDLRQQQIQSGG